MSHAVAGGANLSRRALECQVRPLFIGYLFIEMTTARRNWASINATYGLSRLVALEARRPTPINTDIIAALKCRIYVLLELMGRYSRAMLPTADVKHDTAMTEPIRASFRWQRR